MNILCSHSLFSQLLPKPIWMNLDCHVIYPARPLRPPMMARSFPKLSVFSHQMSTAQEPSCVLPYSTRSIMTLQGKAAVLRTLWTEGLICSVERFNKHSYSPGTLHSLQNMFSLRLASVHPGSPSPWVSLRGLLPRGRAGPAGSVAPLSGPEPMAIGIQAGGGSTSQQTAN